MVPQKTQDNSQKDIKSKSGKGNVTMADLLAQSGYNIHSLKRGQEVTGKIVSVSRGEILIDIGAKSEGIVFGRELDSVRDLASTLSVGNQIEATVLYPENDAGQVVLSLRKLSAERRWDELEEKLNSAEDLNTVALEVNRGGIICDFLGLRGFLPASQVSLGGPASQADSQAASSDGGQTTAAKLSDLVGKTLNVRVIEADRKTNRLIFSQKQPGKKELERLLSILKKVEIGQNFTGTISAILPFGVFVEVEIKKDKLEGLVHISEISWEKVDDPAKLCKVGQKADVKVISKDEASGRLSLSIKQLLEDPFVKSSQKFTKDQSVKGTVSRVTPYGVVIGLESNLEGLVHISKIPPNITYDVGQTIEATVEDVDTKSRRISLVPVVKEKPILYR